MKSKSHNRLAHQSESTTPSVGICSGFIGHIRFTPAWILAVLSLPAGVSAQSVTTGSSSAHGIDVDLSIAGIISSQSGEIGKVSGVAPAAYDVSNTAVPIDISAGVLVVDLVSAGGAIDNRVISDVDGSVGSHETSASSHVANLSLSVADLPLVDPLIELTSSEITATTVVEGESGAIVASPKVSIAGLTLKVLGTTIVLPADLSNVPPNTGLNLSAGGVVGLSVTLNETVTSGTVAGGFTVSTNAIHIHLNGVNLGLASVLDGDIIIGHAESSQLIDSDGDGVLNGTDGDSDGDGIPDAVENVNAAPGGDTDGDGIPDAMDLDSDNDGINDVIEAGGADPNGDGLQDASGDGNADEDGDGLVDSIDADDAVAGGGNGAPLVVPDTDGDLVSDYLDLDSDNDGLGDLYESGQSPASDSSGVLPINDADGDGISDAVDGKSGFGDGPGAGVELPDSDSDGIPNSIETDSDNDGISDIHGTVFAGLDGNSDGKIDDMTDDDGDGIPNAVDVDPTVFGGIPSPTADADGDGINNADEGSGLLDSDGDEVPDIRDNDSDGDGIPDLLETNLDFDGDQIPNQRDLDSDGDGINDVIEAGGTDADGNGHQDASGDSNPDEDGDGLIDSIDSDDAVAEGSFGTSLPVPDTDLDSAPDFLDLDSDNDTISDLVESGFQSVDPNNDGIVDGVDADGDGLVGSSDGLPDQSGDANDPILADSDGDGIPNFIDPSSGGAGTFDIVLVGNGALDGNGDGHVDDSTDADGDGIADGVDADPLHVGGLAFNLESFGQWRDIHFDNPDRTNPAVSGPDADPDHDGFSNAVEFAFGSDPGEPSSIPDIRTAADETGGVFSLQLDAHKNSSAYAFVAAEASRDLMSWSSAPDVLTVTLSDPARLMAQVSNATGVSGDLSKGFIRIRVLIP